MLKRVFSLMALPGVALIALLLMLAGCGSASVDTSATVSVTPECAAAPSIIPKNNGRPMIVEFYRDT